MKEITIQVWVGEECIWKTFMTDHILSLDSPVHVFGAELNQVLKFAQGKAHEKN